MDQPDASALHDAGGAAGIRPKALILIAVAAVALAAAEGADASTVSLEKGTLRFWSSPGEADGPDVNLWPPRAPTEVRVTNDSAGGSGPTAGPGCFYDTSPNPPLVTYVTVRCPLAADGLLPGVKIRLGDGETEFATVDERLRASVYGGGGSDYIRASGDLYGGEGNDGVFVKTAGSRVFGGPGSDEVRAGPGADFINPGAGRDEVWLVNERRGKLAWTDTGRDSVWSRDGDIDNIYCDSRGPADVLRVDGLDWPADYAQGNWPADRGRPCKQVFRSSPPRPLPSAIDSPDYEVSEGTRVWVFCPVDGEPICQGTIMLRIAGRIFGPIRFRVRQGRERAFHLTDREFGWDENNSVAAFITLRLRDPNGRLIRIQESMSVGPSPYDSA